MIYASFLIKLILIVISGLLVLEPSGSGLLTIRVQPGRIIPLNCLLYFWVQSDMDVLYDNGKIINSNIYEINDFKLYVLVFRILQKIDSIVSNTGQDTY